MATDFLTSRSAAALAASASLLLTAVQSTSAAVRSAAAPVRVHPMASSLPQPVGPRELVISYRSHTGAVRKAYVRFPSWYGPGRRPLLPLVISPHGRGRDGRSNSKLWGDLPSIGGFAVVSPDGQGDHLPSMSWGAPGQIADLARMPAIVAAALPELRIDRERIYAFGGSMGGHETLLLVARYPSLLAGAASFDGVSDFALQYRNFPQLKCNARCLEAWAGPIGEGLQALARKEIGGSPESAPAAYAARSALTHAKAIAASCVPLQVWWSTADLIVRDSNRQSGQLLALVQRLNPRAPAEGFVGSWIHTASFRSTSRLPFALARFGLMPQSFGSKPPALRHRPARGACAS
jgi:pimeloyl-ACP methyl ester carboxylesterase